MDPERTIEPTPEEEKIIKSLQRLANKWPDEMMIFAAGVGGDGNLHICRTPLVHRGDPDWDDSKDWEDNNIIADIYGIPVDGGDPY